MVKSNSFESLAAKTSFQFNELTSSLDRLIFVYLKEDSDVLERILVSIKNMSKGLLFVYLVEKRDPAEGMILHAKHFIRGFDILRENRNTLQHAIPIREDHFSYTGKITKLNSVGIQRSYDITMMDMTSFWHSMNEYLRYAHDLEILARAKSRREFAKQRGFPTFEKFLASFNKPALPIKLNPLAPQEDS